MGANVPDETPVSTCYVLPDGSELQLTASRFMEHQRRLRVELPEVATCWDCAPMIDILRREPGFPAGRFTGKTAAQWLAELERRGDPDYERARHWYESVVNRNPGNIDTSPTQA